MSMKNEKLIGAEEHFIFYPTGNMELEVSQQKENTTLLDEEQFFEYACVEIESFVEQDGLDSSLGL